MKRLIIIFGLATNVLSSQTVPHKTLTLEQCIEFALNQSELIKTAQFELGYQKQLKKTATEIPKLSAVYTSGQFNSAYKNDNCITLTQTIPFPLVFAAQSSLANSHIKSSEHKLAETKADLIYQVKCAYYSLLYHYDVHNLLLMEDSIYERFAEASKSKFENGNGTLLEKITTETKVMEIKNMLLSNDEDINTYHLELQTLLHSKFEIDAVEEDITLRPLTINFNNIDFTKHPQLRYIQEQVESENKFKKLERYKILPDLQFGYFNLSIYGPADYGNGPYFLTTKDRLQGISFGLNMPLWLYPHQSKVKAADVNLQMRKSDYSYHQSKFEGEFKQAQNQLMKYQKNISYYKNSALVNSHVIIDQALKSYNSKEINYVDYLSVVSSALEIENNFLKIVYQNDLVVLKLEYLLTQSQE